MSLKADFKVGQFGKIGEHMVGFELSKRGWIIFYPPYDERTDIVAIKFRCKKCKSQWLNEHRVACLNQKCSEYEEPIKSINSKGNRGYKNKVCLNCGYLEKRNDKNSQLSICPKCKEKKLVETARCPKCHTEIKILNKNCSSKGCDSIEYEMVFRSIQVKSSHLVDNGKNIAFNFKYQDLINDKRHFFIVYNRRIESGIERHFYWVLTKEDFQDVKKTDTISFEIYQNDRGHYKLKDLEKYLFDEKRYYSLIEEKEKAKKSGKDFKEIEKKIKESDVFTKLD